MFGKVHSNKKRINFISRTRVSWYFTLSEFELFIFSRREDGDVLLTAKNPLYDSEFKVGGQLNKKNNQVYHMTSHLEVK